jgi:DNA-binding NarL/FixJ family response regulator
MPAGSGSLDSESEETGGPEPEQQDRAQAILQRLTRCQRRVATCLLDGDCEKVIASKLSVSVHTVHTHIRAIYSRLGVHSRAELLIRLMGEEGQRRANNAAPSR